MLEKSKKILVVDDSAILRRLIRSELESGGYEVIEAENGLVALSKAVSELPDLITLDVDMPELDGFGSCEKLNDEEYIVHFNHKKNSRIPIVFVTSNDKLADRQRGFELGAADFITKPFEKGEILSAVNKILKPEKRLKGLTALIVDDSNVARRILADILSREGLNLIECEDGEAAYHTIKKEMDNIDLIVTDYDMPKMDGGVLCRKIRNDLNLRIIPVIFCTAVSDQDYLLDLFKAGATDYLIKPFVKEELIARILVHLERAQLNTRLKEKVNELRKLNKLKDDLVTRMKHNIELAAKFQKTILPEIKDLPFLKMAVKYISYGDVSGDTYYMSKNRKGDLNIFIGDAAVHDIFAAFMSMMVQVGLDGIDQNIPPSDVLFKFNDLLSSRDMGKFITGVYLRISTRGLLTASQAAHPPLIIIPANGEDGILFEEKGLALGMLADGKKTPVSYVDEQYMLSPGDKVFVYTDGIYEWANRKGEAFGISRFIKYLEDNREKPLDEIFEGLLKKVRDFARTQCIDDLTMLGFEFLGK